MLQQSSISEKLQDAKLSSEARQELLESNFPEVSNLLYRNEKMYSRTLGGQVSENQYVLGLGAYCIDDMLVMAARVYAQTTMYQEPWDCVATEETYYIMIAGSGPQRQVRYFTKDSYTVFNENHNWPAPPFAPYSYTPRFSLTGSSLSEKGVGLRIEWLTPEGQVGINDSFSPKEAWKSATQIELTINTPEITPEISKFCEEAEKFADQLKKEQAEYYSKAVENLARTGRHPYSLNQLIAPQFDASFNYAIVIKDFIIDSTSNDQQIATEVYLLKRATGEKARVYRNVSDWFFWPGEQAPDFSVGVIKLEAEQAVLRTPQGDLTIRTG